MRGHAAAAVAPGRLLGLVADRTFPLYVGLSGTYALFRVGSFTNIPGRLTDTASYEQAATHAIWSRQFLAGERGFTIPLFYKLVSGAEARIVVQLVVSTVAWLVLAAVVAHSLRGSALRLVAFAAVLFFSLSTEVILWDTLELSESLTFALAALLVAAWILVVLRPTGGRTALVLVLALLWSFARDTNAYVLIAAGVLTATTLAVPGHRRAKGALALGCVAIGILTIASADAGKRWLQPLRDVVAHRVLPTPALRSYFVARGLDLSSNWPLSPWMNDRARGVYTGYLIRHPGYLLAQPLSGTQQSPGSTPANASSLLDPAVTAYNDNASHRFLPLPGSLEGVAFPRGLTLLCALIAVATVAAAALAALGYARPLWTVPAAILVTTYPHVLVAWHSSGIEVDRHALEAALLLRLALLLLALYCVDAVATRGLSGFLPRLPRWRERHAAGSSTARPPSPS